MPVQPRATDTFTRDNLLLGFSQVTFTPALAAGGFGAAVPLGILSGEELQKEIETLTLDRGDAGLITIDRELVSRLEISMQLQSFNFRSDLAQYIFASSSIAAVTANPAQSIAAEQFSIPAVDPFDAFVGLSNSNIDESTVEITCDTITAEAVGTGDGVLGGTQGDFGLDWKIKAIGDVTSFTVAGVDETAKLVSGSTPTANQIGIEVGEEDSLTTGSGAITFGSGETPALGAAIVATYKPSFSTTAADIVNGGLPASVDNDFVFDPVIGGIRMLKEGADDSPFRLAADAGGQPLLIAYDYNRRASNTLKPFTQPTFEGKAEIKHLTDVGVNFIWTIPSSSIQITDDALTFDAEDFAVGTLTLNVLDAGGSDRFGTLELSSEPEQLA